MTNAQRVRTPARPARSPDWVWNVRKLNEFVTLNSRAMDGIVRMLTHSSVKSNAMDGKRERRIRATDLANLEEAMRVVLTNLFLAWRADPRRGVRLSLRAEDYSTGLLQYRNPKLSLRHVRSVLQYLTQAECIHIDGGRRSTGRQTRIFTLPHLAGLFHTLDFDSPRHQSPASSRILVGSGFPLIRMKKKVHEKEWVTIDGKPQLRKKGHNRLTGFEPNGQTKRWETNLRRINRHIGRANLNLFVQDAQLTQLNEWLGQRALRLDNGIEHQDEDEAIEVENLKNVVDFSDTRLYRVFNNERWDNGGRFYGGWWQGVPKNKRREGEAEPVQFRKHITIDNELTVEVDYSGLHAVMAYARCGLTYDQERPENADAYFDPAWFPSQPDARALHRDFFKKVWQRMLNAKGKQEPDNDWTDIPPGWTIRMAEERLQEKHLPLVPHKVFHSGMGIQLQHDDSNVAEAVMLRLMRDGIVVLPVHDSFIVQRRHEFALRQAMIEEYKKVLGVLYAPRKDTFETNITTESFNIIKQIVIQQEALYTGFISRGGIIHDIT